MAAQRAGRAVVALCAALLRCVRALQGLRASWGLSMWQGRAWGQGWANVVESGSTGGYGWAGQGCGELETDPAEVSPCSVMSLYGFLSNEQDAEDWDSKVWWYPQSLAPVWEDLEKERQKERQSRIQRNLSIHESQELTGGTVTCQMEWKLQKKEKRDVKLHGTARKVQET